MTRDTFAPRLKQTRPKCTLEHKVFPYALCRHLFHVMEKLSLDDNATENSELDTAIIRYANHEPIDKLSLYEVERQILCLYDQLIELRLERAILEAQLELPPGTKNFYTH